MINYEWMVNYLLSRMTQGQIANISHEAGRQVAILQGWSDVKGMSPDTIEIHNRNIANWTEFSHKAAGFIVSGTDEDDDLLDERQGIYNDIIRDGLERYQR